MIGNQPSFKITTVKLVKTAQPTATEMIQGNILNKKIDTKTWSNSVGDSISREKE